MGMSHSLLSSAYLLQRWLTFLQVKAHAYELGLTTDPSENIMKNRSIHVHCPSGAIPKDGPSAGMAHTIALISLFSGKAVPPTMAMTVSLSNHLPHIYKAYHGSLLTLI